MSKQEKLTVSELEDHIVNLRIKTIRSTDEQTQKAVMAEIILAQHQLIDLLKNGTE